MGEEEKVSIAEYETHKKNCGESFDDIFKRMEKIDRALFGEKDLNNKGIVEMTKQIYNSVTVARGGERIFLILIKISSGILVITGAFWAIYEVLKRISIK